MLTFIPKPQLAFAENYLDECKDKNVRYVFYFSLLAASVFGFHLVHHFRMGYGIFSTNMVPYSIIYAIGVVYPVLNMLALLKFRSNKNVVSATQLIFPFFIATITVFLSYYSANANQGITPFAIIMILICFTIQGQFLRLCAIVISSFLILSALLIWQSELEVYSALVAITFTTSVSCIVIAYITERMRIDQFELVTKLNNTNEQLELLSLQDHLSGLLNRRAADEILNKEMARSARSEKPLTILLIDIDNFKSINDVYGHVLGDTAIKTVANNIKAHVRLGDFVARIGGDEFMVILVESDHDSAMHVANRIRQEVANSRYEQKDMQVSVSIGLAVADGSSASVFMEKADAALYNAKHQGKNKVSSKVA